MKVVFRVDSSSVIGSGHIMRCITLADEIKRRGANVIFVSRDLPGNYTFLVKNRGYILYLLSYSESPHNQCQEYSEWLGAKWQDDARETIKIIRMIGAVDWLIIDHYGIEANWEQAVKSYVEKVMVIDDLANRSHHCTLLLDQNYYVNYDERYKALTPDSCRKLLGPSYALLRDEFKNQRSVLRPRSGAIKKVLIFFGGIDSSNESGKVLDALIAAKQADLAIDLVIGANNPHQLALREKICKIPGLCLHVQVEDMASRMAQADLCIGAAGGTTWERCCLGLPAIVMTVAKNQIEATNALALQNIVYYIGESVRVSESQIIKALEYFLEHPNEVIQYAQRGMALVDGYGAVRCVEEMFL